VVVRWPLSEFVNVNSAAFDNALQRPNRNWLVTVNRNNHLAAVRMPPLLMASFLPSKREAAAL
jgi:hypothetical protein